MKKIASFFVLFIGIIIIFELMFQHQKNMPYVLPFLILGLILALEKFLVEKNYWVYLIYNLLVISIILIQYLWNPKSGFFYDSMFHIVQIPTTFLLFYAIKEKKKALFLLSFVVIASAAILNYFYRDDVSKYRMYGNVEELKEKNIEIKQLILKDKNGRDTLLTLSNKKYLIDFWSLYCPVCMAEMPFLDSIKKSDSSFRIISLLTAYRNDTIKEFSHLRALNQAFPSYHFKDSLVIKKLELEKFPNYFIVQENKIVFKGSVEDAVKFYYKD
jgi:thiol-disulfide isomerase/thioredoxin